MDALPEDFQQSLDKFKVPAEEQAELTAGCGRKSDIQQTAVRFRAIDAPLQP